jgi:hypothetical protein
MLQIRHEHWQKQKPGKIKQELSNRWAAFAVMKKSHPFSKSKYGLQSAA